MCIYIYICVCVYNIYIYIHIDSLCSSHNFQLPNCSIWDADINAVALHSNHLSCWPRPPRPAVVHPSGLVIIAMENGGLLVILWDLMGLDGI